MDHPPTGAPAHRAAASTGTRAPSTRLHGLRAAASLLMGVGVIAALVGCGDLDPVLPPSSSSSSASGSAGTEGPTDGATSLPAPSAAEPSTGAPTDGTALAVLATLRVKGRAPMTGYLRTERFGPAWLDVDRNGCDTRNDILRRDLVDGTGTRCKVLSGVLHDPYTGATIRFVRGERTSAAVQIDHVVALGDAWRTGAQQLTQAERIDLANDPVNLFAVDGPTNEQKSDGDAATWLPHVTAFRCTYVAHQVGVKRSYGLWVTPAEKAAMERVLSRCPTMRAPLSTLVHLDTPASGTTPTPTSTPAAAAGPTSAATRTPSSPSSASMSPVPAAAPVVHPGSYCSPSGATGRTATGTRMTCRVSATDSRTRWRPST